MPHADEAVGNSQIKHNAAVSVAQKKHRARSDRAGLKIVPQVGAGFARGIHGLTHGFGVWRRLHPGAGHGRKAQQARKFHVVEHTPDRSDGICRQGIRRHCGKIVAHRGFIQHFKLAFGGNSAQLPPGVVQLVALGEHKISHALDQP